MTTYEQIDQTQSVQILHITAPDAYFPLSQRLNHTATLITAQVVLSAQVKRRLIQTGFYWTTVSLERPVYVLCILSVIIGA